MAAQNGTFILLGKQTGRTYSVDFYAPDAAGTLLTFSQSGPAGSTSPTSFRIPENCDIVDVAIAASPTATNVTLNIDSGVINGAVLRWANQLVTLANRAKVRIPLNGGGLLGGVQAA